MSKSYKKLALFSAGGLVMLILLCTCVLKQAALTLGDVPGQGYLWAYLYLLFTLLGGLLFLLLAKGVHPPGEKPMMDHTLLFGLGMAVLLASVFFFIRTVSDLAQTNTIDAAGGTLILRTVTGCALVLLGVATGLTAIISVQRHSATPKWAPLLMTCFLLAVLVDQTAAILPMPDIAAYGPLVIGTGIAALFFLEISKYKPDSRRTFRNVLVTGWLGGICCLTGVLLWFIYPGLFLGRLEPAILIVLLCTGVFMLLTSVRLLFIGKKSLAQ